MFGPMSARLSAARDRIPPGLRARAWVGVALLAAAGGWLYESRGLDFHLISGDAYQYAIVARRLAAGEGFTTGVIFPAEISFGVGPQHPSLVRPPLWPMALATVFAVTGPKVAAVEGLLFLAFAATVVTAGALAARLAGPWTAALTGLAVAACPQLRLYTLDGVTEVPFALCVTAVFLLCARGAHPIALGIACGCAYLTRYNGIVLGLPVALTLLSQRRLRPFLLCGLGFAAIVSPWWIRNLVVTGDPFYSLYNLTLWFAPATRPGFSLNYMIEPDLTSAAAMHPFEKVGIQLPQLLRQFPLVSANPAACLGVVLGALRRERLSLGFLGVAVAMTLISAVVLARGRYFVPFLPVLLALGAVGWSRAGGRVREVGLALLLLAPLLPRWPSELADLKLTRAAFEAARFHPSAKPGPSSLQACLGHGRRPVVLAQDAERITWATDAISIKLPGRPDVFRRIVEEYPVEYLQLRDADRFPREAIEAHFEPTPGCGPGLYERRPSPRSPSGDVKR
jgi:4-amino-4-deoxy-L-arabinose transferase-like glycosyltransferase